MSEETVPLQQGPTLAFLKLRRVRVDVVAGVDQGKSAEATGPDVRIGTGKECPIALTDPTVSRVHAVVRVEGSRIRVIDQGSTNGTRIDGVDVKDGFAKPDSLLSLGGTTLRLKMTDETVDLPLSTEERFGGMLGKSAAMRRLFALLSRVAKTDTTVLIFGETGTGKELVAEALHEESLRAGGPFVVFDCSAVTASLMESELFGHMRGAFTGAIADRAGAFEAADGGTLFLDEIGELPLDLQPKLLRALERKEVRRVGSNVTRKADVRVVAATNRLLAREVERGKFREDLYYRLAVVEVQLPPLRERPDDIPLLARHFEASLLSTKGNYAALSEDALRGLSARAFPGNVRELRNAVTRAMSLGTGAKGGAESAAAAPAPAEIDLSEPLLVGRERVAEAFERAYVERALAETGGNITRAAELSGVNRKHIQRALRRWGLRGDPES